MQLARKAFQQLSPSKAGTDYGNIHEAERLASLGGGMVLAISALAKGRPLLAVVGGWLAWRGVTGHCPVYQAIGVNTARPENTGRANSDAVSSVPLGQGIKLEESMLVGCEPSAAFEYWRNFENLPRFMSHVENVTSTGNGQSRWIVRGPMGSKLTWDAELLSEVPGERLTWRTLPGSDIAHAGSVHFFPASSGKGTVVTVHLKYNPPAGQAADLLLRLFGQDPRARVHEDLLAFKKLMEQEDGGTALYGEHVVVAGRMPD